MAKIKTTVLLMWLCVVVITMSACAVSGDNISTDEPDVGFAVTYPVTEPESTEDVNDVNVDFYQTVGTYNLEEGKSNLVVGDVRTFKLVEIFEFFTRYDPVWEYLEWGDSPLYCNPTYYTDNYLPYNDFTVQDYDGSLYKLEVLFEPSLYRSYKDALDGLDLIRVPGSFDDYIGGYTVDMLVMSNNTEGYGTRYGLEGEAADYFLLESNSLSLLNIKDPNGVIVWDNTMFTDPREPNTLENAYLSYTDTADSWDYTNASEFANIDPESCSIVGDDNWGVFSVPSSLSDFGSISPLEVVVRNEAAYEFFKNESNNAWRVELVSYLGQTYGQDMRWVDSSGNVLYPLFSSESYFHSYILPVPEDGWVTLQTKPMSLPMTEDDVIGWPDTVETLPWETKLIIMVETGDYIRATDEGVVQENKKVNYSDIYLFHFTFNWDDETIINLFNTDDELDTDYYYWD